MSLRDSYILAAVAIRFGAKARALIHPLADYSGDAWGYIRKVARLAQLLSPA